MADSMKVSVGNLRYSVRIVPADGGYRAQLVSEGIGMIMEPHSASKGGALANLVADLLLGDLTDQRLGRAIQDEVDKEIATEAKKPVNIAKVFKLPQPLGGMYRRGPKGESLKIAVLGDSMYVRAFKMPKWNREATVLDTVDVALRYWHTLGIPTSKDAHRQRAAHFRTLREKFQKEWHKFVALAEQLYGDQGSLISGGLREHWPTEVKDRIRFLAHGSSALGSAANFHEDLSKTRAHAFR